MSALEAVHFVGAEANVRGRRERAVTVRARLAALADSDTRRQDDLPRLARVGAAPADRAAILHGLAELREESAERHAELAGLEPDHADTHHVTAAQVRDHAAHDASSPRCSPRGLTRHQAVNCITPTA